MLKNNKKRNAVFIVTFILSMALCSSVSGFYIKNKQALEYAQMNQLLMSHANKISDVINKLLYKTQILSALMMQNNGEVSNFKQIAATIVDDPCIKNVIIAPDGIVADVYPLEGNEAVVGLDYFSDGEGNKEAIAARDTGELVLGGPFQTVQGGMALVGRLPVYINHENGDKIFWGIVSVTLNYPEALNGAELSLLETRGLAFELWRYSPDTNERQVIASSEYPYSSNANYVEQLIQIQNADWYFRLSPIRSWYQYHETWIFGLCTIIVSALSASLVQHNYDLNSMKNDLETMTQRDALTGILNRRGLFGKLEQITRQENCHFILCYIDLNHFKTINDTYGHLAGDQVLKQFADIISHSLDKNQIFARIGGDEFILIFNQTDDRAWVRQNIFSLIQKIQKIKLLETKVTFCVGTAVYPDDSRSIDELISIADRKMYELKKSSEKDNCSFT